MVPSKRQRRVLKPFPLLRLVLTRPHEAELQLLRLVKAYEADDESLTLADAKLLNETIVQSTA